MQRVAIVLGVLVTAIPLRAQTGWTLMPQEVTRENLWSVAYGSGTVVAVGERGTIVSYDYAGGTWRREGSGTGDWLVGVGSGAGRFVAVGDRGTILTSDDLGLTWTRRESGVATRLNAAAYGAGRWLAVGEHGVVLVSADGTTWSSRPALGSGFLRALAYGQGQFLIGGADGQFFATADGTAFTRIPIATTADIEAVAISPERIWVVGSNGLWASAARLGEWAFGPAITRTTFRGVAVRNAEEAAAVAESGAAIFRRGAWGIDSPAPPFLSTAVTVGERELIAVGFGGGVARASTEDQMIVRPRNSGAVEYGASVTLIGDIGSNLPVTYQWHTADGAPIAGATGRELTIARITPANSDYQLRYRLMMPDGTTPGGSVGVTVPLFPAGQMEVRDPSFQPALPAVPSIIAAQPDGKLLVAGTFSVSPSGGPTYGVARLNADGSLDLGFRAGEGLAATAAIRAIHILGDGRIYLRGNFTMLGGESRPGLARLLPHGAVDPTFQPPNLPEVAKSAAAPDGALYVQRATNTFYSTGAVLKLAPDGRIDSRFGILERHDLVGVDPRGRVLVVDRSGPSPLLLRYLGDGTRDGSYRATLVRASEAVTQGEQELAQVMIADSGLYAASFSWTRAGWTHTFSKFLPDGGRDLSYLPPPAAGISDTAWGFSFAHRPDGGLWQTRHSGFGRRYTVSSYSPTGELERDRYATLPNQADFAILAVAPDGSLLGATGRYAAIPAWTLVRVRPVIGGAGRLTNLSVRAQLAGATEPLIAGFVTGGTGETNTLARGIGPALAGFGVADPVPDPSLTLFRGNTMVAASLDWAGALAARFAELGAFALPAQSRDAALELAVGDGNHTAVVTAENAARGTALVELYQPSGASRRFINLSARSTVDATRPLIAGFSITGDVPVRVLIRAAGPALAAAPFNLPGTLTDPQLTLFRGGSALWENNDWDTLRITEPAEIARTAAAAGAFPFAAGSRDSAMVITLAPGNYTAVVSGSDSGMALVEVYEVAN